MRIDFYSVETPDGVNFRDLLAQANALPNDNSRVQEIEGIPYRLQELRHAGRLRLGDMVRIRMNDIPIIVSLDGDVDEVELEADEGIGEETAFLYDNTTRVLAIQRNRFGVAPSKFTSYFEELAGLDNPIIAAMILREDVARELGRLQVVREFHVRFASIKNPTLITQDRPGTKNAIKLLDDTAPAVGITLAMGRKRGSLSVPAVVDSAKKFLKWATGKVAGEEQVESIKVHGTFDDDSEAKINLLEYRLVENADVPVDARSRRLLYDNRRTAIREAFDRRRAELERMFPPE